jgi:hypothetical protein
VAGFFFLEIPLREAMEARIEKVAARKYLSGQTRPMPADLAAAVRPAFDEIYAKPVTGAGHNVLVYRPGTFEAGVLWESAAATPGHLRPKELPAGDCATAAYFGDYGGLGAAHEAVRELCRRLGRTPQGTSWEIYGHWSDDPAQRRTDVYYLLT